MAGATDGVQGGVEACAEAYRCTQDHVWLDRARAFFGWFLGNNETQSVVYDFSTGGCRDGLQADGPNLNQGAESTLAWLIALMTLHEVIQNADDGEATNHASKAFNMAPLPEKPLKANRERP